MKSKSLKIISAVMALMMVVCCFSACGKNTDETDTDVKKPSNIEGPGDDDDLVDLDDLLLPEDGDTTASETETTAASATQSGGKKPSNTTTTTKRPTVSSTRHPVNTTNPNPSNTEEGEAPNSSVEAILRTLGYEYDAEQNIYYSTINPWQRQFGFGELYDAMAPYANMRYATIKVDFDYKDLKWRIQCWKGQYGVLCGGEMGVYTKDSDDLASDFYECASDENLLEMHFKYYKTPSDFNKKTPTFERELQEHWWLTGFKFGQCNPKECVMEMTFVARDKEMADGIEKGLINVTNNSGKPNGFTRYYSGMQGTDVYVRNGNTIKVLWYHAGFLNY